MQKCSLKLPEQENAIRNDFGPFLAEIFEFQVSRLLLLLHLFPTPIPQNLSSWGRKIFFLPGMQKCSLKLPEQETAIRNDFGPFLAEIFKFQVS
jgi:hypothetical protein